MKWRIAAALISTALAGAALGSPGPEPNAHALWLAGLGALLFIARRRLRRN